MDLFVCRWNPITYAFVMTLLWVIEHWLARGFSWFSGKFWPPKGLTLSPNSFKGFIKWILNFNVLFCYYYSLYLQNKFIMRLTTVVLLLLLIIQRQKWELNHGTRLIYSHSIIFNLTWMEDSSMFACSGCDRNEKWDKEAQFPSRDMFWNV